MRKMKGANKKPRRIRPVALGVVILIAGLLLGKPWWQFGVFFLIAVFVEAIYHYRTLD